TTLTVTVEPAFLALTTTPSMAPSSAEVTWPLRAAWPCARTKDGAAAKRTMVKAAMPARTACTRIGSSRSSRLAITMPEPPAVWLAKIAWLERSHRGNRLDLQEEMGVGEAAQHAQGAAGWVAGEVVRQDAARLRHVVRIADVDGDLDDVGNFRAAGGE